MNLKDMSNEELLLKYKKCIKGKFYITDIEPELLSRLEQIESLKCCGNCKMTFLKVCPNPSSHFTIDSYCPQWVSDGMTREQREINSKEVKQK